MSDTNDMQKMVEAALCSQPIDELFGFLSQHVVKELARLRAVERAAREYVAIADALPVNAPHPVTALRAALDANAGREGE